MAHSAPITNRKATASTTGRMCRELAANVVE
jgi:hypothetical protein